MSAVKKQEVDLLIRKYKGQSPWRTLWFLLSRDGNSLFWALFFFLIKHSPVWIIPIGTAKIIDAISGEVSRPIFVASVAFAILFVTIAQNLGTTVAYASFFTKVRRKMEVRIRAALLTRLQQLSMGFYEQYQSGRTHSKVLRDVENVDMLVNQIVNMVLPAIVGALVMLTVSFVRDPSVGVFFLIIVPIVAFTQRFAKGRMANYARDYRHDTEMMSARVSEMITMLPVTRAHNAENLELDKMQGHLQRVRHSANRLDISVAWFGAMNWVVFQLFALSSLAFTGYLAYTGKMSVGDVVMYRSFFILLSHGIQALLGVYPMMIRGFESIHSMSEILECPDLEMNQGKQPVQNIRGDFKFENVNFAYTPDGKPAVHDFSLHVPEGRTVALVGSSGSGKTTLVNLIIGFRRPSSGRILLDGRDMADLDLRDYRRFLSVVSQETLLFNGSIRDNITYGMESVGEKKLEETIKMANAKEFIDLLPDGLDTQIGEHGARLSGGQRQRLAIARALIRDPKVIILDEATSALDVVSEKLVQEAIDRLVTGRTTFIVAHRLSTIRNADQIVVLKNGKCIELGTREELLEQRGEFHSLYTLQV